MTPNVVRVATSLAAVLVFAACASGSTAPASSPTAAASLVTVPSPVASTVATATPPTPAPSVAPSASSGSTKFTSKIYGYSLTVPAGWTIIQATAAWDGKGAPFHDVPQADQFVGPSAASAWFFGAPTTMDLAAKVKESIAANAAEHGNTCPAVPEVKDPIKIGSEPGTLLAWNCGILINSAIAVHKGTAYLFGFRDTAVHAATDPADRAAFLKLLQSVRFPD
jgi:hypothetical protein